MIRRISLRLQGKVQGVNLRHMIRIQAMQRGLTGWSRNEPNGDVYLEAEGEQLDLQRLYDWLMQSPGQAMVTNSTLEWRSALQSENSFTILP